MIHVLDYGIGNIGSIINMIKFVGGEAVSCASSRELENASKIILPGVGHFSHGMNKLQNSGLIEILNEKVLQEKIPVMGICLGAQMMCAYSEEGEMKGLGWFDAKVKRFPENDKLLVPHMGWNKVIPKLNSPLSNTLVSNQRFYFVNSYYMECENNANVMFTTKYGHEFASGLHHKNIYAVQFHPEKSHKYGIELMMNFKNL